VCLRALYKAADEALEDVFGVLILVAIFIVMVLAVFFRYVLGDSIVWSEEVARYGLVALTFVGAATGFRRDSHIRIDVVDLLGPQFGRVAHVVAWIASCAFIVFLVIQAARITTVLGSTRSAALEMPLAWIYWFAAIALTWASVRLVQVGWKALRGGRR
jgi:TRAP-type C4-dicarboxylate transport system permease small subunit